MSKISQRFGKHCSCHLQSEFVVTAFLEALYSAASSELDLMVLTGGAEEWAAIQ
jgi:hypothetical protein